MYLRISKRIACSSALHLARLSFVVLLCFSYGVKDCVGSHENSEEGEVHSSPRASLPVTTDIIELPEINPELLKKPSENPSKKEAQKNFAAIKKRLRLFYETEFRTNAAAKQAALLARGKGPGFEGYKAKLLDDAWNGQDAVKNYVSYLQAQVENLISLLEQFQAIAIKQQQMVELQQKIDNQQQEMETKQRKTSQQLQNITEQQQDIASREAKLAKQQQDISEQRQKMTAQQETDKRELAEQQQDITRREKELTNRQQKISKQSQDTTMQQQGMVASWAAFRNSRELQRHNDVWWKRCVIF